MWDKTLKYRNKKKHFFKMKNIHLDACVACLCASEEFKSSEERVSNNSQLLTQCVYARFARVFGVRAGTYECVGLQRRI